YEIKQFAVIVVYYTNGQSLTSSESVVEEPGRSVTLSCSVSGFSMGSYWMHWIRQKPGKGLEWIGCIDTGASTYFAQSLQGQFSISKDTSKNMLMLQVKSLKVEDTAVYYCARDSLWLTVSSGQTKPSSIFAVSSCGASSDGFQTLGCVTSGFSPAESLTFSWTGDVTGKVDYPAMKSSDAYTAVSQVQVKNSDWEAKKSFTCKATNQAGSLESKPIQFLRAEPKPATLLLTTPTNAELETGNATFICVASQFSPNKFKFTWKLGDGVLSGKNRQEIVTEEKSTKTFTAVSILEIAANEWIYSYSPVKCEFEHSGSIESLEAKYEGMYTVAFCINLLKVNHFDIIPPSSEDMLVSGAGYLECKATGPKGFNGIRWIRNGQELPSTDEKSDAGTSMSAKTKITYIEWSSGTEYICEVKHSTFVQEVKTYPYQRENGSPSVYLLPPPENTQDNLVTLTCYVKRFYPKDVVVYWLANDEKLNNTEQYQQNTTSVLEVENEQLYSVYSQLVVDAGEWKNGTTFSCLVYHEAIDPTVRMIARSIDNQNNKPTLVSLSMNVPSPCMA
uniref:Ig-like domain-containing protein n=1 Tax=Astyanax mexicanus TaxID=7994 RepID=A0A3B1JWB9_ASTMX